MAIKSAVYQGQQFYVSGSTIVIQGSQCSERRSAGVQDIINEDDVLPLYDEVNLCGTGRQGFVTTAEIVSVEGDIQLAVTKSSVAQYFCEAAGQSFREKYAFGLNADQACIFEIEMLLD